MISVLALGIASLKGVDMLTSHFLLNFTYKHIIRRILDC